MTIKDISTAFAAPTAIRRNENRALPAVDIFETDDNLTLVADMPGVPPEGLDVEFEGGVLTLRGNVETSGKGENLWREFTLADYYRQFRIFEEIDTAKTSAELRNGVLTVVMPKSESRKPRRIPIGS